MNFEDIKDPLGWEVGKHGIEIEFSKNNRDYAATFLPDVIEEENWDQVTALRYLVEKAGYRQGYENVKDLIKVRTYESQKEKMDYPEYLAWKKEQGQEVPRISPLITNKEKMTPNTVYD